MTQMKTILALVLGVAMMTSACADPTAPAAPTPAAPNTTEVFTGLVTVLGTNQQTFTVAQVGTVKVTLLSVNPSAALKVGIGTPSLGTCLVLQEVTVAGGAATILSGTATVAGTFCVLLSDPGTLVENVTYTISVQHS